MRLILLLLFAFLALAPAHAEDADTLTVAYRLDGIDAPEIDQPCLDETGAVYPCGQFAYKALKVFIAGRSFQCDDRGPDRKHPPRRVGWCTLDGADLHHWLVRAGWALDFERYSNGRYKEDQRYAEKHSLGIWKGSFVAPRDFRHSNKGTARLLGPHCPRDARARLFPVASLMPGCEIKGTRSGKYHMPGCRSYGRITNPKGWFCSEEEAIAAGFRRAGPETVRSNEILRARRRAPALRIDARRVCRPRQKNGGRMSKTAHDSETAARGQQVITACAFIHHSFGGVEKVFLPKRADTKKFLPRVFELPGGHIEYGENIRAGLAREILEEFGMNIELGDPFAAFTYTNDVKGSHAIEVIYFARFLDPIANIRLDLADHSAFEWTAEGDIERIYTETKRADDPEFQALRKGFALLRGEPLTF
jgi:endonuclease YncB( thermonuclease family)/8-oxo-dGTP pyrophosphatase MutT (NUDIX family)